MNAHDRKLTIAKIKRLNVRVLLLQAQANGMRKGGAEVDRVERVESLLNEALDIRKDLTESLSA